MTDLKKLFVLKQFCQTRPTIIAPAVGKALTQYGDEESATKEWLRSADDCFAAKYLYRASLGTGILTPEGAKFLEQGKKKAWGLVQALIEEDIVID